MINDAQWWLMMINDANGHSWWLMINQWWLIVTNDADDDQ